MSDKAPSFFGKILNRPSDVFEGFTMHVEDKDFFSFSSSEDNTPTIEAASNFEMQNKENLEAAPTISQSSPFGGFKFTFDEDDYVRNESKDDASEVITDELDDEKGENVADVSDSVFIDTIQPDYQDELSSIIHAAAEATVVENSEKAIQNNAEVFDKTVFEDRAWKSFYSRLTFLSQV